MTEGGLVLGYVFKTCGTTRWGVEEKCNVEGSVPEC